jgi:hypothetical protein
MFVLARVRGRLARTPWLYWAAVGVLALAAGVAVSRAASGVEDARAAWGRPRSVLVATVALAPGDPLVAAVAVRELPEPMVPTDALVASPDGAVARQAIAQGEVVVAHDVAATGPLALIPDGWLAVPVAEAVPSGAVTGTAVRVAAGGVVLADQATVIGVRDAVTLVAVASEDAPMVAQAAASGEAMLLLSG